MTENKKENIDNLLSRFYPANEIEQIKIDLKEADRLFEKYPAPQVSQEVIDEIKLKISRRQKRAVFSAIIVKTAAVAAVVIFGTVLLMQNINLEKPVSRTQNGYQAALVQVDNNIAALEKEIELLRNELVAIRLNENNGTNGQLADSINNIDTEIIETENLFWKG
jgi:cell division protein FtsB